MEQDDNGIEVEVLTTLVIDCHHRYHCWCIVVEIPITSIGIFVLLQI